MSKDWVEDESLPREETLERFSALGPEPTRGPLPAGGVLVRPTCSFGPGVMSWKRGGFSPSSPSYAAGQETPRTYA